MDKELIDVTKKSGMVFVGRIIGMVIGILFSIIVTRYIGANLYGQFMYTYIVIDFFSLVLKLGLDQGLVSFIPKYTDDKYIKKRDSLITFSLFITVLFSLFISVFLFYYSEIIAVHILNNRKLTYTIKILSPLLVFSVVIYVSQGVFRGINKIKFYINAQNLILPIIKLLIIIILSYLGYKLNGLILSVYIATIISSLYLLKKIYKLGLLESLSLQYKNDYIELLKFSFPLMFTGLLVFFLNRTDSFMIGYFLTEDKVGIYNVALKIGTISSFILIAFNTMFAPLIASLYHKGDMKKLANMYRIITKWILGVNLIAFSLILLFSKEIMQIFGNEFIIGSSALVLISIGQVVNAGVGSAGYINIMTGHPEYELYNSILAVGVNIFLNYILIPVYGIEGAAFASLISVGLTNVIKLLLVYKEHKIHPYNIDYLKVISSLLVSFLLVKMLTIYFNYSWQIELVLFSIIFLILFSFVYCIIGLSDDDKIIINAIKSKIK